MKILVCLLFLVTHPCFLFGMSLGRQDTCAINDFCSSAISIPVTSNLGFYCTTGCTKMATGEIFNNACGIGYSSTVWYRVETDHSAEVMNINIQSDSISFINLSVFQSPTGCDQLEPVALTSNNVSCVQGYNGLVRAVGTRIISNSIYYLAITDVNDVSGTFELCVNTLSFGYRCVQDRNIEITARSAGGPLEGPYYTGETISICFNVNSYSAASNGCQWLQGMIPVFGNGWDPSSFDANYQPRNATINGKQIGIPGNGLSSIATWDWMADVDYHLANPYLQVGDFDHNWNVDMCSLLTDPNCPNMGGIDAGCCEPCWGNPLGTILPGGWFAYGINGTCPTPGPPIRVDWGDGINCETMGPWKFCFDLVARDYPDCKWDHTNSDMTLAFFTTTDAETGALGGNVQSCNDLPTYFIPGLQCRNFNNDLGTITLDDVCSGDVVSYTLNLPGVDYWIWTVTPATHVRDTVFQGENGHILRSYPEVAATSPVVIKYQIEGHVNNSSDVIFLKIQYRAWPAIQFQLPHDLEICEQKPGHVIITPTGVGGGKPPLQYLWIPYGDTLQSLTLNAPFHPGNVYFSVYDSIGCITQDSIQINLKACDLDEMYPEDELNDTIHIPNPPANDGNYSNPNNMPQIRANFHEPGINNVHHTSIIDDQIEPLQIFPSPNYGSATIKWSFALEKTAIISIYNSQGILINTYTVSKQDKNQKHIDTQFFDPGVYFINFSNRDFRFVTRMVKM